MAVIKMVDLPLRDKRVMIREDLNVPITEGKVTSDARIRAALPTIENALHAGARVILLSHLGRPKEGNYEEQYSLTPVASKLTELLGQPVRLIKDWLENEISVNPGEVVLCENVRFNPGEKADDMTLSQKMAALCDVFVMDAFGTAHRAEASTHGIAKFAKIACAGPLLVAELEALHKALANPKPPMVAIVGGSKVSTKLTLLDSLLTVADRLIVGGGIANTFIASQGYNVGKSLYEPELLETAQRYSMTAKEKGGKIPIPQDVVVGKEFSSEAIASIKSLNDIAADDMIFDIGPKTIEQFTAMLRTAGTILWNGPVGVFEFEQFSAGTKAIAMAIAESNAFSIAGGGDTLAAIDKYHIADKISYISTGGGAFLEFIEGKTLPAVAVLEERGKSL